MSYRLLHARSLIDTVGSVPTESQVIAESDITRWPDEREGPWEIRTDWAWLDGRLECVGVALWHGASHLPWRTLGDPPFGRYNPIGDGPRPVLASEVRAIPLAGIIQSTREKIRQKFETSLSDHRFLRSSGMASFATVPSKRNDPDRVESDAITYEQLLERAIESFGEPRPGPGRKRELGPEELAKVAEVYLTAWQAGRPPTKAVAEHFQISTSAAAKRVAQCRKAGLLAETTSGRPSGRPALEDDGPAEDAPD